MLNCTPSPAKLVPSPYKQGESAIRIFTPHYSFFFNIKFPNAHPNHQPPSSLAPHTSQSWAKPTHCLLFGTTNVLGITIRAKDCRENDAQLSLRVTGEVKAEKNALRHGTPLRKATIYNFTKRSILLRTKFLYAVFNASERKELSIIVSHF